MDSQRRSRTHVQPILPNAHEATVGEPPSRAALPTTTLRILLGLAWTANATRASSGPPVRLSVREARLPAEARDERTHPTREPREGGSFASADVHVEGSSPCPDGQCQITGRRRYRRAQN